MRGMASFAGQLSSRRVLISCDLGNASQSSRRLVMDERSMCISARSFTKSARPWAVARECRLFRFSMRTTYGKSFGLAAGGGVSGYFSSDGSKFESEGDGWWASFRAGGRRGFALRKDVLESAVSMIVLAPKRSLSLTHSKCSVLLREGYDSEKMRGIRHTGNTE